MSIDVRPPFLDPEPGVATSRLGGLWYTALQCWLVLALVAAGTGVTWRLSGSAPDLAAALDLAGAGLWLCAWPLASTLENLVKHQQLHTAGQGLRLRMVTVTALHTLLAAACLALAPAGVLLAYNQGDLLLMLTTLEPWTQPLNIHLAAFTILLVAGPALVLCATALLLLLRSWLRPGLAALAWLVAMLLAHMALLAGPEAALLSTFRLDLSVLGIPLALALQGSSLADAYPVGLSLGHFASEVLVFFNRRMNEPGQYAFLDTLLKQALAWPGVGIGAGLVLLWAALLARRSRRQLAPLAWPAAAGLLTAAAMSAALAGLWHASADMRFPAHWLALPVAGLAALLLAQLLWTPRLPRGGGQCWQALVWVALAGGGWLALGLPQVAAGQASHGQLALAGMCALVLALAASGLVQWLLDAAQSGHSGWPRLLAWAVVLGLLLPAGTALHPLALHLVEAQAAAWQGAQLQQLLAAALLLAQLALAYVCWLGVGRGFTSRSLGGPAGQEGQLE